VTILTQLNPIWDRPNPRLTFAILDNFDYMNVRTRHTNKIKLFLHEFAYGLYVLYRSGLALQTCPG